MDLKKRKERREGDHNIWKIDYNSSDSLVLSNQTWQEKFYNWFVKPDDDIGLTKKCALQTVLDYQNRYILIYHRNLHQRQKLLVLFNWKNLIWLIIKWKWHFYFDIHEPLWEADKKPILSRCVWDKYFLSPSFVTLRPSSFPQISSCNSGYYVTPSLSLWARGCVLLLKGSWSELAWQPFVNTVWGFEQ